MEEISIIKASPDDVYSLQALAKKTYSETFGPHNTKENIKAYLSKAFSIEQLTKELQEANSQWYIVFTENTMAGFLKVNLGNAQTELQEERAMEIERIYVLQRFQGNSLGRLLMDKAFQIAEHCNVDYVWLGVWEQNLKALAFYKKQGFEIFSQHSFLVGDDEQTDWMMKRNLNDAN